MASIPLMSAADDRRLYEAYQRADFGCFCRVMFAILAPGQELLWNWHHEAICAALEKVARGETLRLLIEAPPRSLKSVITSVMFPAWLLGRDPRTKIIGASYSLALASKLHNDCRAIMRSPRYRGLFPATTIVGKDSEIEFTTARRGGRFVTSPDGTLTGRGGGVLILDDILSAREAFSTPRREATNDWLRTTAMSRLDDKRTGAIVVCCQRLHVGDLPGELREMGGWEILSLPAVAQVDQVIPVEEGKVHLFRAGDLLHPEREPQDVLDKLAHALGTNAFSAQYLQQPVPVDGAYIKREWFRYFDAVPYAADLKIVQSWDIAYSTGDAADWSVCTTWHMIGSDFYLVDVLRGRWTFPDLLRKAQMHAIQHRASVILIEEAGAGLGFLQQYNAKIGAGQKRATGFRPEGSKIERMVAQSPLIEAGHALLPKQASWLEDFFRETSEFPNGRHDDQVDSMSQFLKWQEKGSVPAVRVMRLGGR